MGTEKTVFLVHTARRPVRDLLRRRDAGKQIPWMYLGRDVFKSRKLESEGFSPGPRVPLAGRLRIAAFAFRQSYIDYVGILGASQPPLSWWMTALSERSPYSSDAFLHLCSLSICLEQVRDHPEDLVVFADSRPLLRSLQKNLAAMEGVRVVTFDSGYRGFLDATRSKLSSLGRLGYFTLASTAHVLTTWLNAPGKSHPQAGERRGIILFSWADARSFPGQGIYADPFLGEMGGALARAGHDILRLVQVIPTFSYSEAARNIAELEGRVRLVEEFLSPLDPLRAVVMAIRRFPTLGQVPPWNGLDVADIILNAHRDNRWSTAPAKACLAYLAGRNMGSRLVPKDLVYPFENHCWEKLFCLGMRESSPGTRLLGYAHATVRPLELTYSRSRFNETGMPLPDLILTNGDRSRKELTESGFNADQIRVAGSFRYSKTPVIEPPSRVGSGSFILIATTVSPQESLELLYRCIEVFSLFKGIPVTIKCHPNLPFERLSPHLPPLPSGWTVSRELIPTLLKTTGVLIYSGNSTVVMEAIDMGVPYILVPTELGLDMDILAGTGIERSASDPEDLRGMVLQMVRGLIGLPAGAKKVHDEFFEPPHLEILEECL
jgi:3',5'-cyclic AMP phosphodiesterase CpdA